MLLLNVGLFELVIQLVHIAVLSQVLVATHKVIQLALIVLYHLL